MLRESVIVEQNVTDEAGRSSCTPIVDIVFSRGELRIKRHVQVPYSVVWKRSQHSGDFSEDGIGPCPIEPTKC